MEKENEAYSKVCANKRYSKSNNLELVKIFKDLGISRNSYDREGLAQFIDFYNGSQELKMLMLSSLMNKDTDK